MKTSFFSLVVAVLLVGLATANGQDRPQLVRPLNNPFYSSHNYKHPHVAATAENRADRSGVMVSKPVTSEAQLANYKQQMPNRKSAGGIVQPHTPSTSLADRNYKIQRLSVPQNPAESGEYYVKEGGKAVKDSTTE